MSKKETNSQKSVKKHTHDKTQIVNGNQIVFWTNKSNPQIIEMTEDSYNQLQNKDTNTLYLLTKS